MIYLNVKVIYDHRLQVCLLLFYQHLLIGQHLVHGYLLVHDLMETTLAE